MAETILKTPVNTRRFGHHTYDQSCLWEEREGNPSLIRRQTDKTDALLSCLALYILDAVSRGGALTLAFRAIWTYM